MRNGVEIDCSDFHNNKNANLKKSAEKLQVLTHEANECLGTTEQMLVMGDRFENLPLRISG